jgi:predicted transcriptional regulator
MAAMTVRLDDGLAMRLRLVAEVEERPMSDIVGEAVAHYCAERLDAQIFRNRAAEYIAKLQNVLGA